jgi:uncharacterized SAM-binding protein YcdF (DUF218 family)
MAVFILKKIIASFLVPPGIFIILFMFIGVCFALKRNWKVLIVNLLTAFLLWAISIAPVSDAIFRGLESEIDMPANPQGDVIILLGGGIYDGVADLSGVGAPYGEMLGRIVTAVRLQKRLDIPVIVSGGSVFKSRKPEAPIVRRFLIDLGVPADKVIMEDKSRDTIENAKYTIEICRKSGHKKPILVTTAYHIKRAVESFEKSGMKVVPFPSGFKTWHNRHYGPEDYLPDMHELGKVSTAMKEYIGFIFYKAAY